MELTLQLVVLPSCQRNFSQKKNISSDHVSSPLNVQLEWLDKYLQGFCHDAKVTMIFILLIYDAYVLKIARWFTYVLAKCILKFYPTIQVFEFNKFELYDIKSFM